MSRNILQHFEKRLTKCSLFDFRVLIGAPEAQTRQPGVTKGGAVYRCETSRDDACEEILFDSTGRLLVFEYFNFPRYPEPQIF